MSGGRLFSAHSGGTAVYAATFIRSRRIILELELLSQTQLFQAILIHELFHFAWVRLGNPRRASFAAVLQQERDRSARGELGESSALAKPVARVSSGRQWSYYVCESFCDTAAFLFSGSRAGLNCTPLAERWTKARRAWFLDASQQSWKV